MNEYSMVKITRFQSFKRTCTRRNDGKVGCSAGRHVRGRDYAGRHCRGNSSNSSNSNSGNSGNSNSNSSNSSNSGNG